MNLLLVHAQYFAVATTLPRTCLKVVFKCYLDVMFVCVYNYIMDGKGPCKLSRFSYQFTIQTDDG